MADEVIIKEMKTPALKHNGTALPVLGQTITTQVVDIGTLSAALNPATTVVQLISRGTGFWYKEGGASVSAAADTDGNTWLGADKEHSIEVYPGMTKIDTAAAS